MMDHAKIVLSGIIPGRRDLLLYAMQHLESEHFFNEIQRGIFISLERYYDVAGDVLPKNVLSDLLANSQTMETAKALLYGEAFEEIENLEISDHEFRYSVDALKERRAEQLTGEAITTAFEILERGAEVGRERLQGHKEARAYAYSQFAHIDKLDNLEVAPEGDMRREGNEVLQEYADRKSGKVDKGVLTGIPSVDEVGNGMGRGELIIVAAYTSAGKTQFCCQTAWHTSVMQGKNVFFATSETVRSTVRRRIIARHSRLPQFGLSNGLNVTGIKNGSLTASEEKVLKEVVDDLDHNPNYGELYISQIPRGATLSYVEARMNRQAALWDIDLAVCDYLALLKSDRKRNSEREELNEIIKDAKVYANSFNDGKGVPFLSPWQIRRESYQEALKVGGEYSLSSLSDTAESEKSADQIMTLFRIPETKNQVTFQFLKLRDGEIPSPLKLKIDFRNAFIGENGPGSASFNSSAWNL